MNDRGQVTIEALFIVGLFMLILVSISLPSIFDAENAARDVQAVTDARYVAEQIATAANSIANSYEKKTIEVYIPGYTSPGNTQTGKPLISIVTCVITDGDVLNTTIRIRRYNETGAVKQLESRSFTKDLHGASWRIYSTNGTAVTQIPLAENQGKKYTLVVSLKNITSNTIPGVLSSNCSGAFT